MAAQAAAGHASRILRGPPLTTFAARGSASPPPRRQHRRARQLADRGRDGARTQGPALGARAARGRAGLGRVLAAERPTWCTFRSCMPAVIAPRRRRRRGVPTPTTLQRYFPLCPTLRLFAATASSACTTTRARMRGGQRDGPVGPGDAVQRTPDSRSGAPRPSALPRRLGFTFLRPAIGPVIRRLVSRADRTPSPPRRHPGPGPGPDFSAPRDVTSSRTVGASSPSRGASRSSRRLGVSSERMATMPLTLADIRGCARARGARADVLTFATLNGCVRRRRALRSSSRRCGRSLPPGSRDASACACTAGWTGSSARTWRLRRRRGPGPLRPQRARHAPGRGRRRPDAVGVGGLAGYAGWSSRQGLPLVANPVGGVVE